MSSVARIAAFKKMVSEIVEIVQKHTDVDLSVLTYHLDSALAVSPTTTLNAFVKDAKPYLKEICTRNADFFIDMSKGTTNMLDIPIAEVWSKLSEGEKEKIWENVEKLIVLAERIS